MLKTEVDFRFASTSSGCEDRTFGHKKRPRQLDTAEAIFGERLELSTRVAKYPLVGMVFGSSIGVNSV